jgi:hypothetical protein
MTIEVIEIGQMRRIILSFEVRRVVGKITANVEAWRIAGNSIPSAWLTAVDFCSQFKLRLIAQ